MHRASGERQELGAARRLVVDLDQGPELGCGLARANRLEEAGGRTAFDGTLVAPAPFRELAPGALIEARVLTGWLREVATPGLGGQAGAEALLRTTQPREGFVGVRALHQPPGFGRGGIELAIDGHRAHPRGGAIQPEGDGRRRFAQAVGICRG